MKQREVNPEVKKVVAKLARKKGKSLHWTRVYNRATHCLERMHYAGIKKNVGVFYRTSTECRGGNFHLCKPGDINKEDYYGSWEGSFRGDDYKEFPGKEISWFNMNEFDDIIASIQEAGYTVKNINEALEAYEKSGDREIDEAELEESKHLSWY